MNHDQRDAGDASQFELIVTEETERRKERGNESDTLSRDVLRLPRRCETDLGNRNKALNAVFPEYGGLLYVVCGIPKRTRTPEAVACFPTTRIITRVPV